MLPEFDRRNTAWQGADQSGFHLALDVERFTDLGAFCGDMDHLMSQASRMQPLPDFETSSLPGGRAWDKESDYRDSGIPISERAVASLSGLAEEFGLAAPW